MKQIRLLALFLALLLLASSLFGCQSSAPLPQQEDGDPVPADEPAISVTYELTVRNDNPHTSAQDEYLRSKDYDTPTSNMNGKSEMSRPEAIVLKWKRQVVGGQVDRLETAVISEDEAFTNPIRIESSNCRVELYNLELGQTLYWYVEGTIGSQVFRSDVSTVTVANNAPRTLDVGGVTNCRDLGGWKTADGGTTKQTSPMGYYRYP